MYLLFCFHGIHVNITSYKKKKKSGDKGFGSLGHAYPDLGAKQ